MDDFETPLSVTSKAEGFLEIYNPKNYTLTKLTVKYKWRFRAPKTSCSQKRFLNPENHSIPGNYSTSLMRGHTFFW